jgi:pantetheine-phosphate adenylyltransferase
MARIAVYPASLDPIHNGHIDIAARAAHIFDHVIVAVYVTPKKNVLFSVEERVELAKKCFEGYNNIEVTHFAGLTVNYVQQVGAMAIVRGLRVFGDFEFEFRMGMANKKLAPNVETVAILADEKFIHISSSTVREIAELGGNVTSMVPAHVAEALTEKYGLHESES